MQRTQQRGGLKWGLDIIATSDDVGDMRFRGGKFRCFQKLVNLIPPHRVYIETHLGGGAVLRHKTPAEVNIGIDCDPGVIGEFIGHFDCRFTFVESKAEEFFGKYQLAGDEFVYSDPPYWPPSRRSSRSPYRHDYCEEDHLKWLRLLRKLPCAVMISGYSNETYDQMLKNWGKRTFAGTSQTGSREETIWLNFEPGILHDTRFLGDTFRDRQTVKRKRARWVSRFRREPVALQQGILTDLQGAFMRQLRRPLR
ncbi:MAG TPA: DNA adenine methylase [Verrucomicrobiae bacterium]